MKTIKHIITSFIVLSLLYSCQEKVDIDIPTSEAKLVVEAWFKSDSTTQEVLLSKSVNFSAEVNSLAEENASVYVTTGGGNRYDFEEVEPGRYTIDSALFIVYSDTSYVLNILTEDGTSYRSEEEIVKLVPNIDLLVFLEYSALDEFGFGQFVEPEFLYASLTTVENPGFGDYYVWKLFLNGEDQSIGNNLFTADDDGLQDGARIPFELAWFPDELEVGDTVEIEQMTISNSSFDYFEQLSNQINGGGPFSTPPAPVIGNIKNVDDDSELVLGVFIVSSVHSIEQVVSPLNTVKSFNDLDVFLENL